MSGTQVPEKVQTEVLTSSRRRCCICFGLDKDLEVKRGQIAHLDKNSNNNEPDNLAFLCMDHHDEHDSRTSQSKSFLLQEVKAYRNELYNYWETPEKATHKDIVLTAILDISLAPHVWKNQFLTLVPDGWKTVEKYSTGEIWGSMIAMVEALEFREEDWSRYRSLFDLILPHVVKKIESAIILWGTYLSDDYKHKLQMSLRKLAQASMVYRTLHTNMPDVMLIKPFFREALVNLHEICENAEHEQSNVA